ncbi:MAG: hypothetical protein WCO69_03785 [Candidatus Omnitrophota bacterium]
MRRLFVLTAALLLTCPLSSSFAAPKEPSETALFKKYNADVDKYAFTKNFILSLSYYRRVADRLSAEGDIKAKNGANVKLIQAYIEDRTLDNTELRIARNYLTRFVKSPNGLIEKVSRQAILAYDAVLTLSMRERDQWQALYRFKTTGQPANFNEPQLISRQLNIFSEKKEAEKSLLSASMLLRIVLLSADRCENDTCKLLVLTDQERRKLTGFLDDFARDIPDWGIKAGQSPVEGCVAAIREVLEDKLYTSRDK